MSLRILLIDENDQARVPLATRLSHHPDLVIVAQIGDAEQGLRLVEELRPDVTLVEVKMREADGIVVCGAISAMGRRVMVLTSYLDPDERKRAIQAGASGYLLKEIGTDALARQLRGLPADDGQTSDGPGAAV